MKKFNLFIMAAGLFLAVFPPIIYSQWQADVRLTHDTALSLPSITRQSVATSGDNIHVVWHDKRNGEAEIYYRHSTNKGVSWTSDTRLTNAAGMSVKPSIAVYGSVLHVTWESNRDGVWEIYYKKSTNNGSTWTADVQLTNDAYDSYSASITAGNYVHVVWMDYRHADSEIYYKRSIDGGVNWGADTRLTSNSAAQKYPIISIVGSVVHLVFEDERNGTANTEIYYKRSSNNGASWSNDLRLTNFSGQSWNPFVSASGSYVHVVWDDARTGNREIFYKRSTDEGVNWSSDAILTNNTADSYLPSISLSGIYAHIVWTDERNSHDEIYYKQSTNLGSTWSSDYRLTNFNSQKFSPAIAISGTLVFVVWGDDRDGNYEIYYKRNPTGNPVGIEPIGSEIPAEFSLYQNYPNPFNPSTTIRFNIPISGYVSLKVYDILGNEAATLVSENLNPNTYEVKWEPEGLASGVYFYKLISSDFVDVKKMILVK
jgi:hypothetical protein